MNREDFKLIQHPLPEYADEFRIKYLPTGEESAYYPRAACDRIIDLAIAGKLIGSFLIGVK